MKDKKPNDKHDVLAKIIAGLGSWEKDSDFIKDFYKLESTECRFKYDYTIELTTLAIV